MGRRIVAVTPDLVGDLPDPCRGCAFWESGPTLARRDADAAAATKRAWLAATTSAWGECGQLVYVDDDPAGYVLYAPAAFVPRAAAFATSPAAHDAVLLMTCRVAPAHGGQGLGRVLMQATAKDLTKRGFRAIEAYGTVGSAQPADATTAAGCVLPADYLERLGFATVRDHPLHPRLRLDLRTALTWRDPVGEALGRLRGAVRAFPAGANRI